MKCILAGNAVQIKRGVFLQQPYGEEAITETVIQIYQLAVASV